MRTITYVSESSTEDPDNKKKPKILGWSALSIWFILFCTQL